MNTKHSSILQYWLTAASKPHYKRSGSARRKDFFLKEPVYQHCCGGVNAGVLRGHQRLFLLRATVGGGGNGTYVAAAFSQCPLAPHICSDFLRALGQRGNDTRTSKDSTNCERVYTTTGIECCNANTHTHTHLPMYPVHKFHSLKLRGENQNLGGCNPAGFRALGQKKACYQDKWESRWSFSVWGGQNTGPDAGPGGLAFNSALKCNS